MPRESQSLFSGERSFETMTLEDMAYGRWPQSDCCSFVELLASTGKQVSWERHLCMRGHYFSLATERQQLTRCFSDVRVFSFFCNLSFTTKEACHVSIH